ncbi:reticulocyte binding protein 2 A [Aphelenchoides avenae]|nr:reticulocyte binding protein 2 A [Aphelenchus avenae]
MLREQLQSAERADADLKNRKLAATNFTATLNSNEAQSVAAVAAHEAQLHVMRDELTLVREKTSSVNEEVGEMQMSLESARSSLQQQKALIEEVADKLRTQALNADDTSSGADALERLKETRKQKEEELGKIVAEVPVQRQVLEELNAKKNNQKEADWTLRALEEDLAAAARKKEQMELEESLRAERERLEKERQKLDEKRAEWAQREEQLNKELEEKQKAAAAEEHRVEEERRRLSEEQQRWEESQRQQKQAKTTREEERLKDNSPGPSKRSGDKKPASKRTSAQMDSSLDEDVGSSRSSDEDFSLGKTSRQSRPVFKKPAQTKPAAKRGRPPLAKKIDSVGLKPALSSTPQVSQSTPVRSKGPCAMGLPQATASRSATPSPILRLGIDVPRHSTPLPDHRPVADHFITPARQTPRPATINAQPGGIPAPGAPAHGRPPVMPSSSAPSRAPAPSSSATCQSRSTMESTSARTDPSPQQDAVSPLANFLLDDPSNVTSDPDEEQSHFWE